MKLILNSLKTILAHVLSVGSGVAFGLLLSACTSSFPVGQPVCVLGQRFAVKSYDGVNYRLSGMACLIPGFCSIIEFDAAKQDLHNCLLVTGACACED